MMERRAGPLDPEVRVEERDVDEGGPPAACPFHGMVGNVRFGIAAGGPSGNACALEMGHVPCRMEMGGKAPEWASCPRWNVPAREAFVGHVVETFTVFAGGGRAGDGPSDGLPMSEWVARSTAVPR